MSATEVAEALRAVGADRTKSGEVLASLYADAVELQHDPPLPSDGPISSRLLAALGKEEVAAVGRALPDATMHPSEVTVQIYAAVLAAGAFKVPPDAVHA